LYGFQRQAQAQAHRVRPAFFMLAVYSQNAILKIESAKNPVLFEIFSSRN
jgi:hypothetical protein